MKITKIVKVEEGFDKMKYKEYPTSKTNKDHKVVQELLGHSNIGTTSQYLRLDEDELLDKARKAMS